MPSSVLPLALLPMAPPRPTRLSRSSSMTASWRKVFVKPSSSASAPRRSSALMVSSESLRALTSTVADRLYDSEEPRHARTARRPRSRPPSKPPISLHRGLSTTTRTAADSSPTPRASPRSRTTRTWALREAPRRPRRSRRHQGSARSSSTSMVNRRNGSAARRRRWRRREQGGRSSPRLLVALQ